MRQDKKWTKKQEMRRNSRREMRNKTRNGCKWEMRRDKKHHFLTKNKKNKNEKNQRKNRKKKGGNRKLQEIQKKDNTRFRRDKISARQNFGKC